MKKIDLGQSLEILANIGVLASVLFLAVEINGNTAAIRQQEVGALLDQDQALLMATADEGLAALYSKSLHSPSELSRVELQQMSALLGTRSSILFRVFTAYRSGIATEDEWQRRLDSVAIYYGTTFGRLWWEQVKGDFAGYPEFVDAVDYALETSQIVPDDVWMQELEQRVQQLGQ